jgi:ABC-2 type transport system ATP-binding protein
VNATQTIPVAIANLTKRYGVQEAVSDLTLDVERGSICGLLGPNGSGKTTAFKCLLGLAHATTGSMRIEGETLTPTTFEYLGYVPEKSALYEWMTGEQHLEFNRRTFKNYDPKRAAELVNLFKVDLKKKVRKLSKGQHTALAIVLAFSTRPRILILDEPASGLDPMFQRAVLDLIIEAAANGATVVFSSHQIGQVERAADRVAILKEGKLIVDGTVDSLKGSEKIVEAIFDQTIPDLDGLAGDPRIHRITRSGRILRAYVGSDSDGVARRINELAPKNVSILDLNLEDIFINAVGDAASATSNGDR